MSGPIDVVAGNGDGPDTEELELAHDELGHDAPPSALLSRLRKQATAQQRERHIDLEIGGEFDPPLVARYGVMPVHELERYSELAADPRSSRIEVGIDIMARSNVALFARDAERLVELVDERGSVTFGHRLAQLLELPIPPGEERMPPRDVIVHLFGGNGLALSTHGGQLLTWMQDPSKGETTPGEASGETE
jgi:hypothetical protein